MKKTRQVVMLPTEKAVQKGKLFINKPKHLKGKLELHICERVTQHGHSWSGNGIKTEIQHLYILSDEEIKEGDWVLDKEDKSIFKVDSDFKKSWSAFCKKIIATTNRSLVNLPLDRKSEKDCFIHFELPSIPESFIKAYIKAYNEGNPITEVQVEYEWEQSCVDAKNGHIYSLKLKEDGSIIIHRAKTYTREEVDRLCRLAFNRQSSVSPLKYNYCDEQEDKWIEENL